MYIIFFKSEYPLLYLISGITLLIFYRCQLWEKELETREMKEQLKELVGLLRQSETRRKEVEKELKLREKAVAIALASSAPVRFMFIRFFFSMLYIDTKSYFYLPAKVYVSAEWLIWYTLNC